MRHALMGMLLAAALLGAGCKPAAKVNAHPVAQWLTDNEDCTRATAEAVLRSGLPYPNARFETYTDEQGRQRQRLISRDLWLGPDRFVIPGEVVGSNPTWPEYHPRTYQRLVGTLPNFYPRGPSAGVVDGMGAMVDVQFKCSMEPSYAAWWGKGYRSNEEGIEKVRAIYEKEAKALPARPGVITFGRRDDLGMWELLLDFRDEAGGQRGWEATYWPVKRELLGPDESASPIRCDIRHDPERQRCGGIGWRCRSGMRLTAHATAEIQIYVSHLPHMPAVFDQVQQLLVNAKQPREKE